MGSVSATGKRRPLYRTDRIDSQSRNRQGRSLKKADESFLADSGRYLVVKGMIGAARGLAGVLLNQNAQLHNTEESTDAE